MTTSISLAITSHTIFIIKEDNVTLIDCVQMSSAPNATARTLCAANTEASALAII